MNKYDFINKYISVPYVVPGRSPEEGFDCWGLVYYYYKVVLGINLNHCTMSVI